MAKQNATFDNQKDYSAGWLETFRPVERYRHLLQSLGTRVPMHKYIQTHKHTHTHTHTNTHIENFTDHNTTVTLIVIDVNISETT
jgi:hypothetical protein